MQHPLRTEVKATCIADGTVTTYRSIREANKKGGFTYTSVRNSLRTGSPHAGHKFEPIGKQRKLRAGNLVSRVAKQRNAGMTNPQIAESLGITRDTVGVYASIANKMGLTKTYREVQEDLAFSGKIK